GVLVSGRSSSGPGLPVYVFCASRPAEAVPERYKVNNKRKKRFEEARDGMDKTLPQNNIQDNFLNQARRERMGVTIYLISGVKLTGRIKSFDKYSLILEAGSQEQLIFKHAIST